MTNLASKTVNQVFLSALEKTASEREAYLSSVCAGNRALYLAVTELLQTATSAAAFFDRFENDLLETQLNELEDYGSRGLRLGNYELLHLIAQGGMGAVFLARRADGQFNRIVIIKMLPMDLQNEALQTRFKSERKLLANLQHPNIAQLHDAGITEDGRAYFVMEYVAGKSITDYCTANQLNIEQRLEIFLELLKAVQFAHQNLVVHQDIKPSNVMVDENGRVKLLDFGIASTISDTAAGSTDSSHDYSTIYATPEQLKGGAITTATDTHQLGQLLFELLTDTAPSKLHLAFLKHQQLALASWLEKTARDTPEIFTTLASNCGMSEGAFRTHLKGDLDAIVSHAMQEEATGRYANTELFARDIQAMRSYHPVAARESTHLYRARLLLQRNRYLAAGLAMLVIISILFSGVTAWQAGETARERDKALKVMDLMVEVFETANPAKTPGQNLSAEKILQQGAERIPEQLSDQPEVQADLLEVIGRTQQNLGNYREAQRAFDSALALQREINGPSSLAAVRLLLLLGDNHRLLAQFESAEQKLQQALNVLHDLGGKQNPLTASALEKLGRVKVLQGNLVEAREILQQAAAMQLKLHGNTHIAYAQALNDLASVSFAEGNFAQAESLLRESLLIRQNRVDTDSGNKLDPEYATNINNLGLALFRQGKLEQSEPLFRRAVELRKQIYIRPHPEHAQSLTNLGLLLDAKGSSSEALTFLQRALEIRIEVFGSSHMRVAEARNNLGMIYLSNARFSEALEMYRSALPIIKSSLGEEHSAMAIVLNNMAHSNLELGNNEMALEQYRASLAIREKTLPAGHLFLSYSQVGVGRALSASGNNEAAVVYIREGLALREKKLPQDHWLIGEAQFALAEALAGMGSRSDAEALARSALAILSDKKGEDYYLTLRIAAFLQN